METLETLGRRIGTTEELKSIVHTMKSLSAVSIRQYEEAVAALHDYNHTVELGLRVVLPQVGQLLPVAREKGPVAAVVFGSDHGLCGRFNEQIGDFSRREVHALAGEHEVRWLAVGGRAADRLEAAGEAPAETLVLPGAPSGLNATAQAILLTLDRWRSAERVRRVVVAHNRRTQDSTAAPSLRQLLPLDPDWLARLLAQPWPSRRLPMYSMDTQSLLAALVRECLFLGIYQAGAESIASEHATRLLAMQAAEHNIDENLEELGTTYRRLRQESITEELLDVVAGFEVLQTGE